MDVGDIIQLIIFGAIFLSFFGGVFDRGRKEKAQPKAPRPRELSQSGGQDRPRRTARPRPARDQAAPEGRRQRPDVVAPAQPAAAGGGVWMEPPREDAIDLPVREIASDDIRASERELVERDLTDMPSIRDRDPEQAPRPARRASVGATSARRRHPATGGDVLRGSLKDPDTLERAFIVKEVLDRPLSMRGER